MRQSGSQMMRALGALSLVLATQTGTACSRPPAPPLQVQYAETAKVYMARLVSFESRPVESNQPGVAPGAIEEATFEVLLTLKGSRPTGKTIRMRTEVWPGNCTLRIKKPAEVFESEGRLASNPFADVWILFLEGDEPFPLDDGRPSRPINLFSEEDLQFLFRGQRNVPEK